jgi:hypothetical protein
VTSDIGPKMVARRRAQRELFFWTANRMLLLVLCAAITIYAIVLMCEGRLSLGLLTDLRSLLPPSG